MKLNETLTFDYMKHAIGKKIAVIGPKNPEDVSDYDTICWPNFHEIYLKTYSKDKYYLNYSNNLLEPIKAWALEHNARNLTLFKLRRNEINGTEISNHPLWGYLTDLPGKVGTCPVAGFVALCHIKQFFPEKIFVTGWNLYRDIPEREDGVHDRKRHALFLMRLARGDDRICYDKQLQEAIEYYTGYRQVTR